MTRAELTEKIIATKLMKGIKWEHIAEAVGQQDVEVQEGWQRVASTPRIGFPLLPEIAFGLSPPLERDCPLEMARHPGLPAVTPDFRLASRAVIADLGHPLARQRRDGTLWRQANGHGTPCFPDSHEDVSLRTLDLRTPNWREGYYHPKRVLLFAPPPTGFFPPGMTSFQWGERGDHPTLVKIETEPGIKRIVNPSGEAALVTTRPLPMTDDDIVTLRGINFGDTLTFKGGKVILENLAAKRVVVDLPPNNELIFEARNCLFDELEVTRGLARLEYCTVRVKARFEWVQASDCIFPFDTEIIQDSNTQNIPGTENCVRYSRVPLSFFQLPITLLQPRHKHNTAETPVFQSYRFCDGGAWRDASLFGEPGYGVLHPATPRAIREGAEDRGEMGAYHAAHFSLAEEAVLDKLTDFLPVGLEAVLIHDPRLHRKPPATN